MFFLSVDPEESFALCKMRKHRLDFDRDSQRHYYLVCHSCQHPTCNRCGKKVSKHVASARICFLLSVDPGESSALGAKCGSIG